MQLAEEAEGGVIVLTPEGRLDSSTARELEEQLMARLEATDGPLVLDLGGLRFVSSAGLRIFLVAAKKMKAAERRFALCSLQPQVEKVFEVSGFARILPVEATRETALAAMATR